MAALVCVGDRLAPTVSLLCAWYMHEGLAPRASIESAPGMQDQYQAGSGTYVRQGFIYASVVGHQQETQADNGQVRTVCDSDQPLHNPTITQQPGSVHPT